MKKLEEIKKLSTFVLLSPQADSNMVVASIRYFILVAP